MAGYVWSINNVVWNKDVPLLPVAKGERVELVFVNQTPMPHPMHLHGHEFQVVEIDSARFPGAVRDTILVPPGRRIVVAFDAENPGWWALHCHLLYHLDGACSPRSNACDASRRPRRRQSDSSRDCLTVCVLRCCAGCAWSARTGVSLGSRRKCETMAASQ